MPLPVDQMTDILDIKPAQAVSLFWFWGFLLLLVLGGLALLARFFRRQKQPTPLIPAVKTSTKNPRENALAALEDLDQQGLCEKGQYRKYYFRLSEILKIYLQEEFAIPAVDATTEELKWLVASLNRMDGKQKDTLHAMGVALDLVKFARSTPSGADTQRLREDLKGFILEPSNHVSL